MDAAESHPVKTLLFVVLIAAIAAAIVAASHEFSKDRIAANERARLMASLHSVLDFPRSEIDLNPIAFTVTDPLLGSDEPVDVFVINEQGIARAAIFAAIAPDGYNASIRLLIGVSRDGTLSGVRVVSHRETPGLGDLIDIRKSDWVLQFDGKSLEAPEPALWAVDKDDGYFDSLTGATVTPRAVVKAVKNTLLYFRSHHDELFEIARSLERDGNAG